MPSFTITATIASSQRASENRVHYTGIDCSGHWTYLGRSGPAYRFREVIDRGRGGKCKGSGIVSVKELLSPKRLLYSFRGGGVASRGVLLPGSSG